MPLEQYKKSQSEIRSELLRLVMEDLMGPKDGPEEEVPENRIPDRYIVGRLAPLHLRIDPGETDDLEEQDQLDGDDDGEETDAPLHASLFPSSVGLSFTVDGAETSFCALARWGQYERGKSTVLQDKKGDFQNVWKRIPVEGVEHEIELKEGAIEKLTASHDYPFAALSGRIRKTAEGNWSVSLYIRNDRETQGRGRGEDWMFQVELSVYGGKNSAGAPFCSRRPPVGAKAKDDEERTQELVYRNHYEFAVGHGVAVEPVVSSERPERAERLSISFAPQIELPYTQLDPHGKDSDTLVLDMKVLSELKDAELFEALGALPDAYEAWIKQQSSQLANPDVEVHREQAQKVLAHCEQTSVRIKEGIELLQNSAAALDAFRFANRAMYLQRIHSLYSEKRRTAGRNYRGTLEEFDIPANRTWRMFQLGFILLNLPALTNLQHSERSSSPDALADLLWFPTGGGKTEAYLGLTAYALAIRRLQGNVEGRSAEAGVAVIMRYTLRLLTLQQFQRSAALICACEFIRKERAADGDNSLGQTPFRIGLWVGKATTPNSTDESKEALNRAHGHGGMSRFSGTPYQLTHCPWCGSYIDPGRDMIAERYPSERGRTLVYCSDPVGQCTFSKKQSLEEGIPLLVVDEEIYRLLPSLVIATVDKLAQMPWQGKVQMLFGQVNAYCPRHGYNCPDLRCSESHQANGKYPAVKVREHGPLRPPDLIIQDELHLISGPLGTLVGLYETAVDELCTWQVKGQKVRPKVIASTATIRMAEQQVRQVFDRQANVFPPPGINVEDNFFSRQSPATPDRPGRIYMGINAPGERVKMILIRVYLAFLSAAKKLHNENGDSADPYMTLVGYFNSMRELGGMRRLVEDDISTRLYRMSDRGLVARRRPILEELTSRKTAADIPSILSRLELKHEVEPVEQGREPEPPYKKGKGSGYEARPIDVLLATNMISVGVDVKRFGLMVVGGQPKTTAEYIQATSRIGRSSPGIVCTVYNWTRPRDLSHYESFHHYHDTFYKHVEANSVTPFSERALDRGLNGVFVALVRLLGPALNHNNAAETFDPEHELVRRTIEVIKARARRINGETYEQLQNKLEEIRHTWEEATKEVNALVYRARRGDTSALLYAMGHPHLAQRLGCLNSLREVEVPANLVIIDQSNRTNDQ
tara:strand:+ start:12748 stop:16221 length:3474 start_codon:yes stop_codon:yes gene_type:complete